MIYFRSVLLYSFLFLIHPAIIHAQWIQTNGPATCNFRAIGANGNIIFAGTEKGVFRSDDSCRSWTNTSSGMTDSSVNIITVSPGGERLLAVTNKALYISTNNGLNWENKFGEVFSRRQISFLQFNGDGSKAYLGLPDACILVSNDMGDSWQLLAPTDYFKLQSFAINGGTFFISSQDGGIKISTDNGVSWNRYGNGIPYQNINVTVLHSAGSRVFAGTTGGLYVTTDLGQNWTKLQLSQEILSVNTLVSAEGKIYAGTSEGLYESENEGVSWTKLTQNRENINVLDVQGSNIYAGSSASGFLYSNDRGLTWKQSNRHFSNVSVYSLLIRNNNLFSGTGNGVYHSSDNGESWYQVNKSLQNTFVQAMAGNSNYIFAGTKDGVFRSPDSGKSWMRINTGLMNVDIHALIVKGDNIFAGNNLGVFLAANNSREWKQVTSSISSALKVQSLASDGSAIYAGTQEQGEVYVSDDNGTSWTKISSGLPVSSILALGASGSVLYAGTQGNGLYISHDSGQSWQKSAGIPGTAVIQSIVAKPSGAFISVKGMGVYVTENYGSDWKLVNPGLQTADIPVLAEDGVNLYAGTIGRGVWSAPIGEIVTGVEERLTAKEGYALLQNYPNPFNPATNISYSIPEGSHVKLKVYDITGREVATLVNEAQPSGRYTVTFDASHLSSGIYIYRLQAGSFVKAGKVTLLK